ncbi:ribosomal-protein-alanine N-acetyltransferase [Caulobacter ginsengisoli]|uniref:Ribosomal-protein-alanine N-acetyltransferase n=1 Tax=Caulobacter ginsengisoli TaxID=400775 RepID=A0ABU0IT85_9CAUL|nr:GNAT family N-acetyltransferase [Caulobacter ginsengisoli]MDQ0465200.1 ribosomal-protein-alanine N-acetyltransferase [Caulobacter ginsengisoli]
MNPRLIEPTPAETERLAAIHASAFDEVWGEKAFADLLSQPGMFGLATDQGLILCRHVVDEGEVVTLAVTPAARRQGQARALIEAAQVVLVQLGAATLFLEVSAENPAAINLYAGLGFEQVGRRRDYYADGSDALVMRLSLNR